MTGIDDDVVSNKSGKSARSGRSVKSARSAKSMHSYRSNKSATSSQRNRQVFIQHDFQSAAQRAKLALEQARLYEKKIENRVNYL